MRLTKSDNYKRRKDFMTEDDMKYIDDCLTLILQNRGEMSDLYARWEKEDEAYNGDQPLVSNRPNTRVNIFNANIEGQVSALVEQNIAITTRGESPGDESFADWARIGLEWTLRKNHIKKQIEQHERRRLKFGTGIFNVYFDEDAINGFGLAKICCTPLNRIFIDNKIKDALRLQEAEYIAEAVRLSQTQFEDLYGKDKSSAIQYGTIYIEDTAVFNEKETMDDNRSATLIRWWERKKGKLRLIEFTGCGLLLYDSFKGSDKEENQKGNKEHPKSFYKYVCNKYPYFATILYPEEGVLWGFGDGKLLRPIQEMINNLYDKIRMCAKPNLVLFDTMSDVDLEDFDENSIEPRPFNGGHSVNPVISVPWGTINDSWWRLLTAMHEEAQRVTRFSELMMGTGSKANTATESVIQQQQGNAATTHKKMMLEETLVDVCEYALGLMMEFYKGAKAFRLSEDKNEYEWIDFRKMSNVPVMKPAESGYGKAFKANNVEGKSADWQLLEENGKPLTKTVDLDIEISIGAGLPKNKAFLWQMIEKLSAIVVTDGMTGQSKNLIDYEELRKFIKNFLGVPLEDKDQQMQQPMIQQQQQLSQQPMQNPNAPLSQNGNPMMGMLPQGGGGM